MILHFDISKAQPFPQPGGIKASVKSVQKINWTVSVLCFTSLLTETKANGENLACALSGIVWQSEHFFFFICWLKKETNQSGLRDSGI